MEKNDKSKRVEFLISTDALSDNPEVNDLHQENIDTDKQHKLNVLLPPTRSRSPVTVQEWVASLPDPADEEDEYSSEESDDQEDGDTFTLGAEAGFIQPQNASKPHPAYENKVKLTNSLTGTNSDKRRLFQHSDTAASFRSNFSTLSASSTVSEVLFAREADPGEVLLNLGFGGSETLAKIPARFLKHKSKAKGITVENFISNQVDLVTRLESGSYGYRGLQGCPSRIPSDIVEKILNTLKESEKELRRKHSILSMTSSSSFGVSAIPSRFHLMNPVRKTVHTIVDQVSKSTKSFNGLAPSNPLVKPENSERKPENISEHSVIIDEEPSGCVSSDYSDDSDWSDEEREKLEKLFGEMSVRAVDSEEKKTIQKIKRGV
eukprot:TRINITY_DN7270_c0_g1_i2.p1 TRINITY_DN7270_c0_g1~~TRINITY_DN7270_c0_g1_i2.p1  ORF type:complete len:377 (-),score=100.73 TRINITY_DN7270_c0_g1_i2:249-1379(-)